MRPGVVIVEHRNGYVHANAGIDKSNISSDPDDPRVLLLPVDADASAARLRDDLAMRTGIAPQVIINDSAGRAWRTGERQRHKPVRQVVPRPLSPRGVC